MMSVMFEAFALNVFFSVYEGDHYSSRSYILDSCVYFIYVQCSGSLNMNLFFNGTALSRTEL